MKKTHIAGILIIAFAIALLVSNMGASSTYSDFATARDNTGKSFTVVGHRSTDHKTEYNPKLNPNVFSFYLTDKHGISMKVVLNQPKPQDFDKSEDIVVKGVVRENTFYAKSILLKCPSKYVEESKMNT